MRVYPQYDTQTRTWFIQGFHQEGKTISQLLSHIPPHIRKNVQVVDYYVGRSAPTPRYALTSIDEFMKRPDRSQLHSPKTINTALISKDQGTDHPCRRQKPAGRGGISAVNAEPLCRIAEPRKTPQKRVWRRPPKPSWEVRSTKGMAAQVRFKLESQILDMWAAGHTAPEIACKLNLSTTYIGAQVIPRARTRGDVRAVVRNPESYGSRRSGFHKEKA